MKGNVLFLDTVHLHLQQQLEANGWSCTDGSDWTMTKIIEEAQNYKGIVIRSRIKLDKELLSVFKKLIFIARAGAGMENIDQQFAESRGITCINAPEGNRNAVAEHAMGMLLALLNNLVIADQEVRKGIWLREENRGVELEGKSIGIIGFGNTGSMFAHKLIGFNLNVLAYDPYITIDSNKFPWVIQTNMQEIFKSCEIISFHVPLTEETNYLVNENYIENFSNQIYVVNTSRGKVVKTDDLVKALESGKVKGAALDVLDFESLSFENLSASAIPDSFNRLVKMKNVILSPHIAGWTVESHRKISEILAQKIITRFT